VNEYLDIQFFECQIGVMKDEGIHINKFPDLKEPILIAGFDGWGNALDISKAMVSYLIHKLKAESFAEINPDHFYRFDKYRPEVEIKAGTLIDFSPPGGAFYYADQSASSNRDLVILRATEPSLRWFYFVDELFSLCKKLGVKTIISIGSMYDNVLHSDRIISGIASSEDFSTKLLKKNVIPINYHGPSGIHATLHSEGQKKGFQCISLWCHCPYYLEGTTHFGLLSNLGSLLSLLGGFKLDMKEIETSWKELNKKIQDLIEDNPELHAMINELRKAKVRGSWASMKESGKKNGKIINLKDFLEPR